MCNAKRTACGIMQLAAVAASLLLFGASSAQAQTPLPVPLIKEGTTVKVSDHVWVIPDGLVPVVPNIGIVVGSRATLIIDTGLGIKNGETVMREVAKLSKNTEVYVATTHFHAEHTTGGTAFPANFKFVSTTSQQEDVKEFGASFFKNFESRSPDFAALMKGSTYPRADITFERDYTLDLGGVRVQLTWLGPTHTRGDTAIFVEGENILFAGDLAMKQLFPAFSSPYGDANVWLASLDKLDAMRPKVVVGSHGGIGDASVIGAYRDVLKAIGARTKELKAQGKSEAEIGKLLTDEFTAKYPDWIAPVRVPAAVAVFYKLS
jgi:glyoxylase-like metal-dependent hydrolase (beta-lactamase superfamily II)